MRECAGQNWSGTHCTTVSSSHWNRPVRLAGAVTEMLFSAARRSATGPEKVTMIGCATPTVWQLMGRTDATETAAADGATAARLAGAAAVIATRAIPAAAIARRSALAMASYPEETSLALG